MGILLTATGAAAEGATGNHSFDRMVRDYNWIYVFLYDSSTEEGTEETSGNALHTGMWGLRTDNKWFLWDCH